VEPVYLLAVLLHISSAGRINSSGLCCLSVSLSVTLMILFQEKNETYDDAVS